MRDYRTDVHREQKDFDSLLRLIKHRLSVQVQCVITEETYPGNVMLLNLHFVVSFTVRK